MPENNKPTPLHCVYVQYNTVDEYTFYPFL